MRQAAIVLLVLIVLLTGLPLAMSMNDMPPCPNCSSVGSLTLFGMCAAIIALARFAVALLEAYIRPTSVLMRLLLLVRPLEKPPRGL